MIILKLNERVIFFWVIFDNSGVKQETMTVKFQFFSILTIETRRQKLIVKVLW